MTPSEAASIIVMLTSAFPDGLRFLGDEQAEATRMLTRQLLLDLDYEPAMQAVARCIASVWKKWPAISEVRAAVIAQISGRPSPGGEAWGSVRSAIHGAGVHRVPGVDFHFRDPIVARCVVSLGWTELCNSEMMAADRARFIELYDKLAAEVQADRVSGQIAPPPPLRGLPDGEPQRLDVILARLLPKGD